MRPRQFASTAFIISAMAILAQPAEKIPEFGPASVKVNAPGAGLQTGLAENPVEMLLMEHVEKVPIEN